MNAMLGFAAGIMVAASFFSLLEPGIKYAEEQGIPPYIPAVLGFLIGCGFLWIVDRIIPHMHNDSGRVEGVKSGLGKSFLLVLAITLHNIPEGIAVGVAFGALSGSYNSAAFYSAVALAVGMGIQNFPEGIAVAFPARKEGASPFKAWFYGQLSGIVEIPAALVGVLGVSIVRPLLPYAMSFAAGAMIYVVFDELIPEAHADGERAIVTFMVVIGFALMMLLDVGLG